MALTLDARQRAMLEEMHIRVWSPRAAVAPATVPPPGPMVAPPPVQAPPAQPPARPPAPVPVPVPVPVVAEPLAPALAATAPDGARSSAIAAMDWAGLQQSVATCQACKLCGTRRHTVFGVGPSLPDVAVSPRADWLVVGEAPGEQEDLRGEPFVGPSGKLLDNMLGAIGVTRLGAQGDPRGAAFITNVIKCRPPGNRNPELDEIALCEPYLRRQIELLQPRVILAVGRFAVQSLLSGSVPDVHTAPLGRLRGKVYRYAGVPVVVSYHPAYLLRSLPEKAKAWADLCLAQSVWEEQRGGDAESGG